MPIILICTAPYAESCIVVTKNRESEMLSTMEECFEVSRDKAKIAIESPNVYHVKPLCQEIKKGEIAVRLTSDTR